jgi:kynurenine formamidase
MYRDLSHPIETGMTTFPGDPDVSVQPAATVETDGYRVSEIHLGSHAGTHVDAPSHVGFDQSLDAFGLDQFVFDATVVDCTAFGAREAIDSTVLPDDDDGDMIVFRTGWDDHWGTSRYLDHPYLSVDCVNRCLDAGWSVALDTLNPDPTPSANATDAPAGVPAHRALLGEGLLIVENLTNLAGLDRCRLFAVPLSLPEGDGSPVRAFARER